MPEASESTPSFAMPTTFEMHGLCILCEAKGHLLVVTCKHRARQFCYTFDRVCVQLCL